MFGMNPGEKVAAYLKKINELRRQATGRKEEGYFQVALVLASEGEKASVSTEIWNMSVEIADQLATLAGLEIAGFSKPKDQPGQQPYH